MGNCQWYYIVVGGEVPERAILPSAFTNPDAPSADAVRTFLPGDDGSSRALHQIPEILSDTSKDHISMDQPRTNAEHTQPRWMKNSVGFIEK